jgi:hypothetical protein
MPRARRAGPDPGGPFPRDDPLPGAYELHLPADDVTICYTVTGHKARTSSACNTQASTPDSRW